MGRNNLNYKYFHDPKTTAQLGLTLYVKVRYARYLIKLEDNTITGYFLRYVMELVLRLLSHPPIQVIYAQLLIECHTGHGLTIEEEDALAQVQAVLALPLPRIIVDENPKDGELAHVEVAQPHDIYLNGVWLDAQKNIDSGTYEYDRCLFFWTVVMMHEFGHYIFIRSQWLDPKTDPGDDDLLETPVNVVAPGKKAIKRYGGRKGESGYWIEAQIFGYGSGTMVMENSRQDQLGHIWWRDRSTGLVHKVSTIAITEFVDLSPPVKDVAKVWPVRWLFGAGNVVKIDDFDFHWSHLSVSKEPAYLGTRLCSTRVDDDLEDERS